MTPYKCTIDLTSGKVVKKIKAKSNKSAELKNIRDLSISATQCSDTLPSSWAKSDFAKTQNTKDNSSPNDSATSPKGTLTILPY